MEAARVYAAKLRMAQEAQDACTKIVVLAKRRIGQELIEARQRGEVAKQGQHNDAAVIKLDDLKATNVDRRNSAMQPCSTTRISRPSLPKHRMEGNRSESSLSSVWLVRSERRHSLLLRSSGRRITSTTYCQVYWPRVAWIKQAHSSS